MSAAMAGRYGGPTLHFSDALRIGVLVGEEGGEVRLEAHFMDCESCRESALRLVGQGGLGRQARTLVLPVSCAQARNALFRYFEQGRELIQSELDHLNVCGRCSKPFLGSARSAFS